MEVATQTLKRWVDAIGVGRLTDPQIQASATHAVVRDYLLAASAEVAESTCTGITARWCPRHGLCECPQEGHLADQRCPLHSEASDHASGM